ncbi:WhiB family transcriptional regulator [Corynebacterium xerosis]|uniref:WhiB family transcriptional regulator n=1 Tax=Corynebacterium xerosis TaxID=1725 RepID=UPI0009EC10AA
MGPFLAVIQGPSGVDIATRAARHDRARRICRRCPVQNGCRDAADAMPHELLAGMWAGTVWGVPVEHRWRIWRKWMGAVAPRLKSWTGAGADSPHRVVSGSLSPPHRGRPRPGAVERGRAGGRPGSVRVPRKEVSRRLNQSGGDGSLPGRGRMGDAATSKCGTRTTVPPVERRTGKTPVRIWP